MTSARLLINKQGEWGMNLSESLSTCKLGREGPKAEVWAIGLAY